MCIFVLLGVDSVSEFWCCRVILWFAGILVCGFGVFVRGVVRVLRVDMRGSGLVGVCWVFVGVWFS